jgi:hypothetical protein
VRLIEIPVPKRIAHAPWSLRRKRRLRDYFINWPTNASSEDRFPKIERGDSLPEGLKTKAWGIRHKTQDGVSCLAIESKKFDRLVHPPQYAERVRKLLVDGGYTVPGKEGRRIRQIKVQGFGSTKKPYFVCVRLDRLPEREP